MSWTVPCQAFNVMHGDCCNTQRSTRNTGDDACRERQRNAWTHGVWRTTSEPKKKTVIIYSTSRSKLTQHFSFHRRQKENIYAALFHTMKLHEGRWASSKMHHRSGLYDLYSIFNSFLNSLCRLTVTFFMKMSSVNIRLNFSLEVFIWVWNNMRTR